MVYIAFRRKTEEDCASKQMQWVFLGNKKKDGTNVKAFFYSWGLQFSVWHSAGTMQSDGHRGWSL